MQEENGQKASFPHKFQCGNKRDDSEVNVTPETAKLTYVHGNSILDVDNDEKFIALNTELLCAKHNNDILNSNIDTLKAVVNQLATQLDLANSRIALYEQKIALFSLRKEKDEQGPGTNKCYVEEQTSVNDNVHRIATLHALLRKKEEELIDLRHEMIMRDREAKNMLHASLVNKDKIIIKLMDKVDELQRIIDIKLLAKVVKK